MTLFGPESFTQSVQQSHSKSLLGLELRSIRWLGSDAQAYWVQLFLCNFEVMHNTSWQSHTEKIQSNLERRYQQLTAATMPFKLLRRPGVDITHCYWKSWENAIISGMKHHEICLYGSNCHAFATVLLSQCTNFIAKNPTLCCHYTP